ncbi:MAG: hypothetical protein WBZ31_05360 [Thiobacillus sp.]|jgi:hypothetical protein
MNTPYTWMLGLAALGLALATPAQANPDGLDGSFMVARRDTRDDVRQDPRAAENKGARSPGKREAGRDEPSSYGYGYERRQQQDQPGNKGNAPRQPRH